MALIWERDEPGTAVHVTYRYGTFSSYNAWSCGGTGRWVASLNSDLCEILRSSKVPQHTGHAATACGIVMRYLLKNEVLFQLRNDILPLASSWGLPDLRCLSNKRSTQSKVQWMQISGNYWEFQIQICHHLVLVLIRLACGFPVSKWVVLEQKDFFFFSLAYVSSASFLSEVSVAIVRGAAFSFRTAASVLVQTTSCVVSQQHDTESLLEGVSSSLYCSSPSPVQFRAILRLLWEIPTCNCCYR